MNCSLINIKDNNSLSTIQETTLAFQAKHPTINLTPQQINQHLIQLKNKKPNFFQTSKTKTLDTYECLLELNTNFPNLTLTNTTQLFCE